MVFMFTDGKPDGKDANSVLNRPDEAIKAMSEYDIEVMVLGLNSRQSIDDVAKKQFTAWQTQRSVQRASPSDPTATRLKLRSAKRTTSLQQQSMRIFKGS